MKIALGSTSKHKVKYLHEVLETLIDQFDIVTVSTASGISEQPLSLEETILGATNRAEAAFEFETVNIGIGIEGGMHLVNNLYHYLGVVVIYDGDQHSTGISDFIPMPKKVSELVNDGGYVAKTIREYVNEHQEDEKLQNFIDPIVNRRYFFARAINNAWQIYTNNKHFK